MKKWKGNSLPFFDRLYQRVNGFQLFVKEGEPLSGFFDFEGQFPDEVFRFVGFGYESDVVFPGVDVCFKLADFADKFFAFADDFGFFVFAGVQGVYFCPVFFQCFVKFI